MKKGCKGEGSKRDGRDCGMKSEIMDEKCDMCQWTKADNGWAVKQRKEIWRKTIQACWVLRIMAREMQKIRT